MPAHAQISGRVPSNKFASRKHASAVSTVLSSEFSNRQMPAIRHASDVGVIFPDFRNQSPAFWYSSPSNKILPILKQSTASFEVLAAWTKVCDFSNASFAELKFALPPSRNSHSPNSTHASLLRSVTNSSKCFTAFFAFEKFCCSMYAFTIWSRQRSEDLVFFDSTRFWTVSASSGFPGMWSSKKSTNSAKPRRSNTSTMSRTRLSLLSGSARTVV
mmetsp:Transcript_26240/g.66100  ORF Transcript_26240/g.66100 Transcript_26240/m.66100 type:complete len:216 (+) Transcript_26240:930-1577(+)